MINAIIKNRKSIRTYDAKGVVTEEQIKELLEAAMLAPSACNLRPWEFIVITNRQKMDAITKIHPYAQMLKTAQAAIIVVALPDLQKGKVGEGMWQHDCGAATENILLQAADMGLGTCWCGIPPKENVIDTIRKMFDIPKQSVPFCVIAVGVPAEKFGARGFYEESKIKWIR
jgi:nitroreductase